MRSDAMRPRSRPRPEKVRPRLRPRPNDLLNISGSDNERRNAHGLRRLP